METRDQILEIVKRKGPVIPSQIAKEIGSNILMASAHLAELTESRKLRISRIKYGGSPLYYCPGQESMLQKYSANLNEKEKKSYDLLSEKKILRDSEQAPVVRVALREIRDFAMPLTVKHNDAIEIFWKWYLINDEEAERLIKSKLNIMQEQMPSEKKILQKIGSSKEENPKPLLEVAEKQKKIEENKEIKPIEEKVKEKKERKSKVSGKESDFLINVRNYFEKSNISVISTEVIRKAEADFIIQIPSIVGNLRYFCRARDKKKISDSDLSAAFVKGQLQRLPVLFVSGGDLTSKAQDMLGKELNSLTFKQI